MNFLLMMNDYLLVLICNTFYLIKKLIKLVLIIRFHYLYILLVQLSPVSIVDLDLNLRIYCNRYNKYSLKITV